MKYSLCFTIAILIAMATVRADDAPQYPVYAWTKTITGDKVEIKGTLNQNNEFVPVDSAKVSGEIKNILASSDVNSLILYHRPGMTTHQLVSTLLDNDKIGHILKQSSPNSIERSYTNVVGDSIVAAVQSDFANAKTFVVDSQQTLDELKNEIRDAQKPFIHQCYIVEIPLEDDKMFDNAVFQIEKAFSERTLNNHISVLAGSPSTKRNLQAVGTPIRYLATADPIPYLNSNILTKALVLVPLALMMIAAILIMYAVQTPSLFVEKSIDFGKIEK